MRLGGYCVLSIFRIDCERFMNVCMKYGFVYYGLRDDGEGHILITVPLSSHKNVLCACRARKIAIRTVSRHGLIPMLSANRERGIGIFVGVLLSFMIFFLSQSVVWRIDVWGNEDMTSQEIIELLEASGLSLGSRISTLETDVIEQRVMIRDERVAWISVNLTGTVASVQVREALLRDTADNAAKPANLVAKLDGEIVGLEVYSGFCAVKEGDTVRAGQLLVSGISESPNAPLRYTRAYGKVFARVTHDFKVEIPLFQTIKVPTGGKIERKTLNFFGKSIKLFINCGNLPSSCDIMNYEYTFDPFSLGELPISLGTTVYSPYTEQETEISEEDAMEKAYEVLRGQMDEELGEAQILKKTLYGEVSDGKYILVCRVVAICDIAKTAEFEILKSIER